VNLTSIRRLRQTGGNDTPSDEYFSISEKTNPRAPACVRVQYDNSPYNTEKYRGVKRDVSLCSTPRECKAFTIGLASMRERFVASDNDALRVYDRLAAALDKNSLRPHVVRLSRSRLILPAFSRFLSLPTVWNVLFVWANALIESRSFRVEMRVIFTARCKRQALITSALSIVNFEQAITMFVSVCRGKRSVYRRS